MRCAKVAGVAGLMLFATLVVGGCAIDVNLFSEPKVVQPGEPVRFDVQVTNLSTCPVGGVVSLLFPFVPRNFFIDQIGNDECRQTLSDAADAFCTGGSYEFPDSSAGCRIEAGELICEIDGLVAFPAGEPVAAPAGDGGNEVACQNTGESIVCRIPESLYADTLRTASAESEESLGSLQCVETPAGIVVCAALLLDPAETKSDHIFVAPEEEGAYRNWILSFATVNQGVCSRRAGVVPGFPNLPCESNSDCGVSRFCRSGICSGGDNAGYGCLLDDDCPEGTCTACDLVDEDEVQAGVACTTTLATAPVAAPALSWWGLLAGFAVLCGAGSLSLARARRKR